MIHHLSSFLDLFFPHSCAGCGSDIVQPDEVLCANCMAHLPFTGFIERADNPVEKIFYGRLPLAAAGSAFYFTRPSLLQQLLLALKYRQHQQAGIWLGRLLGRLLKASGRFSAIDAIVPVPLHRARARKRGYNQAELLAQGISAILQQPVITDVLVRQALTATQTHKGRTERLENLHNAFVLRDAIPLAGKHVLLIDDVITTGATLEACGQTLLRASPASLSVGTVAYTLL